MRNKKPLQTAIWVHKYSGTPHLAPLLRTVSITILSLPPPDCLLLLCRSAKINDRDVETLRTVVSALTLADVGAPSWSPGKEEVEMLLSNADRQLAQQPEVGDVRPKRAAFGLLVRATCQNEESYMYSAAEQKSSAGLCLEGSCCREGMRRKAGESSRPRAAFEQQSADCSQERLQIWTHVARLGSSCSSFWQRGVNQFP